MGSGSRRLIVLSLIVLTLVFVLFQNCAQKPEESDEVIGGTCAFENTDKWDIKLASKNIKAGDTVVFKVKKSNVLQQISVDFADGSEPEDISPDTPNSTTQITHVFAAAGNQQAALLLAPHLLPRQLLHHQRVDN